MAANMRSGEPSDLMDICTTLWGRGLVSWSDTPDQGLVRAGSTPGTTRSSLARLRSFNPSSGAQDIRSGEASGRRDIFMILSSELSIVGTLLRSSNTLHWIELSSFSRLVFTLEYLQNYGHCLPWHINLSSKDGKDKCVMLSDSLILLFIIKTRTITAQTPALSGPLRICLNNCDVC